MSFFLPSLLSAAPHDVEIRASHAHALVRVGRVAEARASLERHLPGGRDEASVLIERWTQG